MSTRAKRYLDLKPRNKNEAVFKKLKRNNIFKARIRTLKYIGMMLGLVVVFMLVCIFVFFRVHSYEITGNTAGYDESSIEECTGIERGMNIYFADLDKAERNILKNYPFVRSVRISRSIPTTLKIDLDCDPTSYFMDIENEYFVLTADLRVAARYPDAESMKTEYPNAKKLVCSDVKRAVVGENVTFMDSKYYDEAMTVLTSVEESDVFAKLTGINMRNKFDVQLIYDDRFKALLGGTGDFRLKLSFLNEIMKDMEGSKGTVDVSDAEVGYVIINNMISFTD